MEYIASVGVYDYERHKLCDLYDSQVELEGQAYNIQHIRNQDGVDQLTFNIPYMTDSAKNIRWDYLKNEYLIRLYKDNKSYWFVANKPVKSKNKGSIEGSVTCNSTAILLKTKNIYKEFDDENGIGTVDYLMNQVLAGTGWTLGYCEVLYEADGTTEKIRSLNSSGKKGSLGLINSVCNLFRCRPEYDTDAQTVSIYSMKNRDMLFEVEVGKNLDALSASATSDDIITRLYVEGEYGDHGYVGIDDVNPTGLPYLLNFDYYREIGVFTDTHEAALQTYLEDITDVVERIKAAQQVINEKEDDLNSMIGQCKLTVYYTSQGFSVPMYLYGNPSAAQKTLAVGDEVVVVNSNGTHRYETIVTNAQSLIQSGDYAIAKFATKASGSIGAREVQIEAKEKEIDILTRKISGTTKPDKIAEYQAEIAVLQNEIGEIYNNEDGLYDQMAEVMNPNGILNDIHDAQDVLTVLQGEQDEVEADFIVAMGNLLRDGAWQNNNYIVGQEEALLADAQERMDVMSRPSADYSFDYIRMHEEYGVPMEDIKINAIVRVNDDNLDVHENLFVTKVVTGVDHLDYGKIEVSNDDFTLQSNDLGSLLSRMSQLSDLIDQKNAIYSRAEAISKSGTFFADRLNGMIDVTKNQILSSISNWYTDDNGNIVFESVDGGSAMMLSGAGFMLADSKSEDGEWNWRTMGTGHGFTADEIVAGFLSADRIEAGSINVNKVAPNFGSELVISGNAAITDINTQLAEDFSTSKNYKKGDLVRYGGRIYVFNQNKSAGPWDDSVVSLTTVTTQMELLPDQIIAYVGEQGYSKTYIQPTDPKLDPDKIVTTGDYWIKSAGSPKNWGELKLMLWSDLLNNTWFDFYVGKNEIYCLDSNNQWVRVYNTDMISEAYTRIEQNKDMIQAEARRANAAEGVLNTQLTITAQGLNAEVTRATSAEGTLSTKIQVNANAIATEVARAIGAEDTKIAKTSTLQTADQIVSSAVSQAATSASSTYIAKTTSLQTADAIVNTAMQSTIQSVDGSTVYVFNTSTAYSVGTHVIYNNKLYEFTSYHSAGAWNANQVRAINVGSAYITKSTVTMDSNGKIEISSLKFDSMGSSSSGIYISPTSVKISSGGTFQLTSTYFNVDTDGTISATKGTIGAWTIDSKQIKANSSTNHVALDGSTDTYPLSGLPTTTSAANKRMYAMWCGADDPQDAPFSVTKDGIVTIQSLRINKGTTANPDYTTVDMRKWTTSDSEGSGDDPSLAMGKLNYQTIKSITVNDTTNTLTMKITNGSAASTRTINFSKPAPAVQTYLSETVDWTQSGWSPSVGHYDHFIYSTRNSFDDTIVDSKHRYLTLDKASTCIRVWKTYNASTDTFGTQDYVINCDPLMPSYSAIMKGFSVSDVTGRGTDTSMYNGKLYNDANESVGSGYWYLSSTKLVVGNKTVYYD